MKQLLAEWIGSADSGIPDGPSLLIYNPAAPRPQFIAFGEVRNAMPLEIASQASSSELSWRSCTVAHASSRRLPFQASSFGAAVLCHVVSRGEEPELAEACRLLRADGRLFILGLNRFGMHYLGGKNRAGLPGIRALALRDRLEKLEMKVLGLLAAGFARTEWPRQMNQGFSRMLVPLGDIFLIVAGPAEAEIIKPLAKSRLRAVGSPFSVAGR